MMTAEEASVATSIWPITKREHGSGRKKLNKLQREAITLACNNDFTVIQGPPGIQCLLRLQILEIKFVSQGQERVLLEHI